MRLLNFAERGLYMLAAILKGSRAIMQRLR